MKITKYGVATVFREREVDRHWYPTKKEALEIVARFEKSDYPRKYIGEKKIDLCCDNCGADLKLGDDYIKKDVDTRYCADCYEAETFTYYTVGGEPVGGEDEIEVYDSWDFEVEQEENDE